ncbi:MAG: mannosyltransferase [Pseudopedobacter saltans]|uniref:Mannosyltransferase n=1 Tax=Pseudopedobacter saltans TaxID=151895 RepID=A0A2W5FBB6_9SPHI|nr:MAG: mannosyltransferase [Pseudopedobacter saltans]
MNDKLHIVCFTIPYPVNYGGIFDLFYKLKALKENGVAIHLHCIQYGSNIHQPELEKYCTKVSYYKRKKIFPIHLWGLPYIVKSRIIKELVQTINQDKAPVLIEGIHCSGIAPLITGSRKIIIRLHNAEYVYYDNLANSTLNIVKRIYYKSESKRLKVWEKFLVDKGYSFNTVSLLDKKIYETQLNCKNVSYLPLFLPDWKIKNSLLGKGTFCLYQGNLDVEENQEAVKWLIQNVFTKIDVRLYVAGKSNGKFVRQYHSNNTRISWFENPSDQEMNALIENAHIHILPSFNATGIKIKLLNALYNGRFCLVNEATVKDSGLEQLCTVANSAEDFQEKIMNLFEQSFSQKDIDFRTTILDKIFDNKKNAMLLKQQLFET